MNMDIVEYNTVPDSRTQYKAPRVNVIQVDPHGVLCGSTDTGAVTIEGYTEETLEW